MSFLSGLKDFITGDGVVSQIANLAKEYFPPDMSDLQKAEFMQKANELEHKKKMELADKISQSENDLTNRIAQLEGTAQELRTIPILGPVVIFLRGLQRLVWGYGLLYFDWLWLTAAVKISEQAEGALLIMNLLILGFLFGERAIQNLSPLIERFLLAKNTPS